MVDLGPYTTRTYDSDDGYDCSETEYKCAYCDGTFGSFSALHQHCRMTSLHEWCWRCDRAFRNESAMDAHVKYSQDHNLCPRCDIDFPCAPQLSAHKIEAHHWCSDCDSYFMKENNLRMHRLVHRPRDLECYGCRRLFPSFSAMLIHLEAGNCDSGTNMARLRALAARHPARRRYVRVRAGSPPYYCPSCKREFTTLSGLYQHAEHVPSCRRPLRSKAPLGGLHRYIRKRVL